MGGGAGLRARSLRRGADRADGGRRAALETARLCGDHAGGNAAALGGPQPPWPSAARADRGRPAEGDRTTGARGRGGVTLPVAPVCR